MLFSSVHLGLWVLGKTTTEFLIILYLKYNTMHMTLYLKYNTIHMTYHRGCWPWPLGRGSVCQVSPLYVDSFLPPFSCFTLWKEVTLYLREGKLCSLRGKSLHKSFGILLPGDLFLLHLFIHSIIHLHRHEFMDIYFIPWVMIQYYLIYFDAQIVPALAIRSSFC